MGFLSDWADRWASTATGPTEEHRDHVRRSLTAAGAPVNLRAPSMSHSRREEWQGEAWGYRETIPEMRFAGDFVANSVGRVRVFGAENRPRGEEPIPLEEATRKQQHANEVGVDARTIDAVAAATERLNINQHGSNLMSRFGENREYAGECFLVGERDGEGGEEWSIRSVSELQITAGGARLVDPDSGMQQRELRDDEADVMRLWDPHPRLYDRPDAPVRSLLDTLEGMYRIARRQRAYQASRIANGTVFYVPLEMSLGRPGGAPVSADIAGEFDDPNSDPFMVQLTEHMMNPMRTGDGDPAEIVPMVIRGPAFFDNVPGKDVLGTVQLHAADPKDLDSQYEALVMRFARGISLAPERVKGIGEATSTWTANAVTADEVKFSIEPRCERMCDSLTAAYLRRMLKAMGIGPGQIAKVCLWFDPSELVQNPNRGEDAKAAHTANAMSDAALLRHLGFSEDDAPDELEVLRRSISRERLAPASVPLLAKILDGVKPTEDDIRALMPGPDGQPAGSRRIVDATPGGPRPVTPDPTPPVGQRSQPATASQPGALGASAVTAAAKKGRGPRDDPGGPSVAGVALMAADTGRVLMLQRGLDDDSDPAAGTWEFPGGHVEDGDSTSFDAGRREWAEEVGRPFPDGGHVLHTWTSPDGVYQGHVVVVATEDGIDLDGPRTVKNADQDYSEQSAWWDVDDARRNPALRKECRRTPWSALKKAAKTMKSPAVVAALAAASGASVTAAAKAAPQWRLERRLGQDLARVDRELVTRILAHADATVGVAIARAANRVRADAQKDPSRVVEFPKGADPVPIVAAAGRRIAPRSSTVDKLLGDAFVDLACLWDHEVGQAADSVEALLEAALTPGTASQPRALAAAGRVAGLADEVRKRGRAAWRGLKASLVDHSAKVLFGEHLPTRDGEQSPGVTPTRLIRDAVAAAGGADSSTGPFGGVGTGPIALDRLRVSGALILGHEWEYGAQTRAHPFWPHKRLDETQFVEWDDPQLKAEVGGFPDVTHYFPGDHLGCGCVVRPLAILPMTDGADPASDEVARLRTEALGK